jgi:MFS family permease
VTQRSSGLWQNRDFMKLWAGETISVFGSLITRTALPFTAILYLHATALQVALLAASDVMAGIIVGLVAGVWVDRLYRRPIMIAADLGRAILVGSIPVAAVGGVLGMPQLYLVAFSAGVLTMFFDVAYQSYLPTIVEDHELIEGNSKLTASASVAEFGAFSIGGWLVQLITGPGAIFVDAVSFLFSALFVRSIRVAEPVPPAPAERQSVLSEIIEGLSAIAVDPVLRAIAGSWVAVGLANGLIGAVILLFTSRELGFSPGVLGLIFGVGGVTSLLGALAAGTAARRLGVGGAMIGGMLLGSLGPLLVVGARDASLVTVAILVAQQCTSDPGITIYEINQISVRQAVVPARLLGRVNSAIRFAGLVAMLAGTLIAGAVATAFDARAVIIVGGGVMFGGALVLIVSPVRKLRLSPPSDPLASGVVPATVR